MLERLDPEQTEKWIEELNSPVGRREPDAVEQTVIDDEMALFMQATQVLR